MPATCERKPFPWPNGASAAFSLSFDDARVTQVDNGLAILNAAGIKATFFVTATEVAKRLDGWRAAVADGHEIGNHTLTHPCTGNYPMFRNNAIEDLDLAAMARELDDAQDLIQQSLGVRPVTFAYPCSSRTVGRGAASRSYIPLVAERFIAGRDAGVPYPNLPGVSDMHCLAATATDTKPMDTVYRLIDEAVREGGWMVMYGHEVADKPAPLTTECDNLRRICEYLKSRSDVWTDTVASVARYVAGKWR